MEILQAILEQPHIMSKVLDDFAEQIEKDRQRFDKYYAAAGNLSPEALQREEERRDKYNNAFETLKFLIQQYLNLQAKVTAYKMEAIRLRSQVASTESKYGECCRALHTALVLFLDKEPSLMLREEVERRMEC